jgi:hypothetical protein
MKIIAFFCLIRIKVRKHANRCGEDAHARFGCCKIFVVAGLCGQDLETRGIQR